ncbi:SDR family oxidoreductase, partial [Novosphingobium sp. 1949]
ARTVGRDRASGARSAHAMALFESTVAINLSGTFRCCALAAQGMVGLDPLDASGARGVIVNTASIAAQDGQIGQAAYAASKGGVLALTLPLARDLMDDGIRVNAILPGVFATPMVTAMPQGVQDALAAAVPFPKRLGEPRDFAQAVLFAIENDYLNGAAIRLDGAIRMGAK